MRQIKLTQGKIALVDDEDYEKVVAAGPWFLHYGGGKRAVRAYYAYRNSQRASRKGTKHPRTERRKGATQLLHRFILNITDRRIKVDHKNHDGLDCRKDNLRICDDSQNQHNRRKTLIKTSSRFKGVCWDKSRNKWIVTITLRGKPKFVGRFASELKAAIAYNDAVQEHFGEFSHPNPVGHHRWSHDGPCELGCYFETTT